MWGRGGCKNYQDIKKGAGAKLILLLRTVTIHNNFPFEAHFQPTLPDNYCTVPYNYVHKVLFRSQETKNSFFLIGICFSYENCTNVKC